MLLSAVLLLALASTGGAGSAPDFTLKDVISGKEYTLSRLRGQVVMLNFFTFTCEPCKKEMPYLQQLDQEFKSRGFQMIGIGLASTPEQLRSLAQQLGVTRPRFHSLKDALSGRIIPSDSCAARWSCSISIISLPANPVRKRCLMTPISSSRSLLSRGFQMIGIGLALSTLGAIAFLPFLVAQQLGISYPILLGTDEVSQAYGQIDFVPTSFIIDRQGNIAQKIFMGRTKDEFTKLIKPLL